MKVTTPTDYNRPLSEILKTLKNSKDMLTAGRQAAILQAIAGMTGGVTSTCDLSDLDTGQQQVLTEINTIASDRDQLDDIIAAINTAKTMILNGQQDLASSISDVIDDLETAKAMILEGQTYTYSLTLLL